MENKFIKIRYNQRAAMVKEKAKHPNGWTWDEAVVNVDHVSSVDIETNCLYMDNGNVYMYVLNEDINWFVMQC